MSAAGDRLLADIQSRTIGLERNQSKLTSAINSLNKTIRNQAGGGRRLSGSTRDDDRPIPPSISASAAARSAKKEMGNLLRSLTKKRALGIGAGLGLLAMFGDLFDPNKIIKDIGKDIGERTKKWKTQIQEKLGDYVNASLDVIMGRDTDPSSTWHDEREQIDRLVDAQQELVNRVIVDPVIEMAENIGETVIEEINDPENQAKAKEEVRKVLWNLRRDNLVPWIKEQLETAKETLEQFKQTESLDPPPATPQPATPTPRTTPVPPPPATPTPRNETPGITRNEQGERIVTPQSPADRTLNANQLDRALRRRNGEFGGEQQRNQLEADSKGMTYEKYLRTGADFGGPPNVHNAIKKEGGPGVGIDPNDVAEQVGLRAVQHSMNIAGKGVAEADTVVGVLKNALAGKDTLGKAATPLSRVAGVTAGTLAKYATPIGWTISAGQGLYAGFGIHSANKQMRQEEANTKRQANFRHKWNQKKRAAARVMFKGRPDDLRRYNKYLDAVQVRTDIGGMPVAQGGAGWFGMGEWLVGSGGNWPWQTGSSRERNKDEQTRFEAAESYIKRNNPKIMAMEDELRDWKIWNQRRNQENKERQGEARAMYGKQDYKRLDWNATPQVNNFNTHIEMSADVDPAIMFNKD